MHRSRLCQLRGRSAIPASHPSLKGFLGVFPYRPTVRQLIPRGPSPALYTPTSDLDALLAARRPDVAHLHNIYHQLTPSIIATLSRRGVPVVMTLHDYKLVCPSYTMFAHGAPLAWSCAVGSALCAMSVRNGVSK